MNAKTLTIASARASKRIDDLPLEERADYAHDAACETLELIDLVRELIGPSDPLVLRGLLLRLRDLASASVSLLGGDAITEDELRARVLGPALGR